MIRLQAQTLMHGMLGDQGVTRRESNYRRNFARLVDKAIREYQRARQAVLDEIEEYKNPYEWDARKEQAAASVVNFGGRPLFIFGFIDHFETCVNAANQARRLFDRLKKEELLSGISRDKRRLLEAYGESLRPFRDAVEHVDEEIRNDKIAEGRPVMLAINEAGDRAMIGEYEIELADVAKMLRRLYEIGQQLFTDIRVDGPTIGAATEDGGSVRPEGVEEENA